MSQVYIISATRSAVGGFGGALRHMTPIDLATIVAASSIKRSGIDAATINHAVFGHVIHTEPRDLYLARTVGINAGLAESAPALTVNRLCGSGLQAIVNAAQMIMLGDAEIVLAGGVEVMSRGGYLLENHREGTRMGNSKVQDMMLAALHDPFGAGHMGITAENVAVDFDISREAQDSFALESQRRAAKARKDGLFTEQITPIEIPNRREKIVFDQDEHIRTNVDKKILAGLGPIFKEGGSVTAGNSSGINDGAAAVILASDKALDKNGTNPLAKIVAYGFGGVAPRIMGMGPVPATQMALDKSGLKVNDLDLIESNEAFAAQACAVSKQLGFSPKTVNPNGGAIALGHPIGATGAIIMTKLVYELRRRGGRYGLATMCIGGGQGISVIIDAKI